ncbi:ABC transporter ATP-binding protein [Shewanella gelidii]|uniref:ABC transporter n=1 Tax=Shewanella gelidii TaxID=1642821 RepID=A0A917JS88_9GAMM|nr:energy-coupling factor ABC transporter ATP-binding protein [Shewanella gelidii]MCL1099155.1 energy-coupling factor ABC transporter ATP-binding protein [Shewanella gelidii]GGI81296.1 ABC transporter [Shewanella gelidii]
MIKLVATDLKMQFEHRTLFEAKHLHFCQGDVVHLRGDNGSGKSTLMKILAGIQTPTQGKIEAQGFQPGPWWRSDSLLGKALYLHQHPYLYDGSVEYNMTYALPAPLREQPDIKQRISESILHAELGHLLQQNATLLSGGERQRLAIARAYIMQPKLLMLDEPTSNMDKDSQQLVLNMIAKLKHQGTGLLISSHQSCELTQLCHQEWKIAQQQITTSANVTSSYQPLSTIASSQSEQTKQEQQYVSAN